MNVEVVDYNYPNNGVLVQLDKEDIEILKQSQSRLSIRSEGWAHQACKLIKAIIQDYPQCK